MFGCCCHIKFVQTTVHAMRVVVVVVFCCCCFVVVVVVVVVVSACGVVLFHVVEVSLQIVLL